MQAVPTEVRRVQQTLPLELQEPGVGPGKGTLVEEQYALCSRTISVLAVIERTADEFNLGCFPFTF